MKVHIAVIVTLDIEEIITILFNVLVSILSLKFYFMLLLNLMLNNLKYVS